MDGRRIRRSWSCLALALALLGVAAPSAAALQPTADVDPATRHHHPDVAQPPTRIIKVSRTDVFNWEDFGIGAGGTLGVVLLAGGTALVLKRAGRQKEATAEVAIRV